MSARKEKDNQIEEKIRQMLINQPELIKFYITSKNNMTSMSRRAYLRYLIDFNDYLNKYNIDFEDVKPMHIETYIGYLKDNDCQSSIINARLSAIISFYKFLMENEIIIKNPCLNVKKLKNKKEKEIVYITPEEIEKLKSFILNGYTKRDKRFTKRDYCLFILGYRTGLRLSALLNIDIDDINMGDGYIIVTEKGNITRKVMFGEDTKRVLLDWGMDRSNYAKYDERALFINKNGDRLTIGSVEYMVNVWGMYIGKHLSPHKLRSTCAMTLYDKTGDIYLVQQQLGHKDVRNTMIYAKATEKKMRETVKLLDNM